MRFGLRAILLTLLTSFPAEATRWNILEHMGLKYVNGVMW